MQKAMPIFSTLKPWTEEVPCPICSSAVYKILRPAGYPSTLEPKQLLEIYCSSSDCVLLDQLVQCLSCSLIYLNPRMKAEIILGSYMNSVDFRFVAQDLVRIKTFKKNLKIIAPHLQGEGQNKNFILDVGCASGAFLKAASDFNLKGMGIEPNKWLVEFGRKQYGVDIKQGILMDFQFSDSFFSAISLWDVLEHVYNPQEVLQECQRILRKEGILIINYPDYSSLARRFLGYKWPFFLNVHLYYFTLETIDKLLKQHGFQIFLAKPFWQILEMGYILERISHLFPAFSGIRKVVSKLSLDTLPVTYTLGQTLILARKMGHL